MKSIISFLKNSFFGSENIKKFILELIYTFSSKKSLLSSKRIERALLFISSLVMIWWYFLIHRHDLTAMEIISIITTLLVYAGFQVRNSMKEGKDEENKENTL